MVRAAMPEAAVHKDRQAITQKHDVRAHAYGPSFQPIVLPKTQPPAVEGGPQKEFRPGVAAAIPPHHRRGGWTCRFGIRQGSRGHSSKLTIKPCIRYQDK